MKPAKKMLHLGENGNLLTFLQGEFTLLNARLTKLDIYNNQQQQLVIDLYLTLLNKKTIRLRFTEIEEFSFYHTKGYSFYNVERYKFLQHNNQFYICLDPVDEEQRIAVEDQDFILANRVEGTVTNN